MSVQQLEPSNAARIPVDSKINWGLLLVRLAIGIPFIIHGAGIAFGVLGGPGLKAFQGFTHLPMPVAALVGYGEFLGGLGVLFGVLSRLASAGLAIIMLGAVFRVHLPKGYDVTKGGFEYALTHLFLTVAIMIAGPGTLTVMSLLRKDNTPTKPILQ